MEKGYGQRKNEKVVIQRQHASANMTGENAGILLRNDDEEENAEEEDEENAAEEDEGNAEEEDEGNAEEEDEENVDETEELREAGKTTLPQPSTFTGRLGAIYRPSSPVFDTPNNFS